MKMSKRIFVCLIALAIGVSMLALGVSANGEELKYNTENHASILEYYEEPIIFGLNFEDEEAVADDYTHEQLANGLKNTTAIVEGENGKYLSITGGKAAMNTTAVFLNWSAESGKEIDDFIFEFDLMTAGDGKRVVEIYVGDTAATHDEALQKNNVPGTSILKIDFANGKIEYVNGGADGTYTYATVEAALAADTFYHFNLNYGVQRGSVTLEVTLGEQTVASYTDGFLPTNVVGNVRIGSSVANMPKSTVALDNVIASGGSFARMEADKLPESERAVADFIAICENPDIATEEKVAVVTTGMSLIFNHGFVGETEQGIADVASFKKIGVGLFVDELNACVNGVAEVVPYDELVEYVNGYKAYLDLIPDDISFMDDAAACETVINAYNAELERLETLKTDSEAVLAALADLELSNTNIRSYGYLKPYYEAIKDCDPYIGYPGIAELIDSYNTVIDKFEQLSNGANAFIQSVDIATHTANTFGMRFNAFTVARDNYFDDPAFEGIEAVLSAYADLEAEMNAVIALCDGFIGDVNRADYSQYLSAKQNALDSAALALDEINANYLEYPGVTDAIEKYGELVISVGESVVAAESYVSFVRELVEKAATLSKEELQAEIDKAVLLQQTGNVIGVEGVTEANIALNNMQSDLELTVGYKTQFANLVSQLLGESDNAAKFDIALDALEAVGNAEKYEGVDSADKAKLDSAIAEYNAKIAALNAGFAAANDVACNTVSASSGSSSDNASVGMVIAIIKKFFE
ncbi:MAG: hypothetical protein IKL79_02895 [Clostridia bacterium]|nr:hypothetical protein [Clostridia bacterium]